MTINIATAFYDAMFACTESEMQVSDVERVAMSKVREVLNSPDKLSQNIPPLPAMLTMLNDPNADFLMISEIIERDPSLAAEVLRMANSSHFHHGEGEIRSLRKAVALIGVAGIASIASTIMIEKIRPASPIYYKIFGRQIWVHSIQCAFLCKEMAETNGMDEFDAYFLGLIHDIGKIIIFNCICEAFVRFPLKVSLVVECLKS